MKSLTKEEILSMYVDKVASLKRFIRTEYKNVIMEDTDIFKDITELEILERVMGFDDLSLEERSKLILQNIHDEINDDDNDSN